MVRRCCVARRVSRRAAARRNSNATGYKYRFADKTCADCPLRGQCVDAKTKGGRRVIKNDYEKEYQAARAHAQTEKYREVRRQHPRVERKLAELVRWHGGRRARFRGVPGLLVQFLVTAVVVNVKRNGEVADDGGGAPPKWLRPLAKRPPGQKAQAPGSKNAPTNPGVVNLRSKYILDKVLLGPSGSPHTSPPQDFVSSLEAGRGARGGNVCVCAAAAMQSICCLAPLPASGGAGGGVASQALGSAYPSNDKVWPGRPVGEQHSRAAAVQNVWPVMQWWPVQLPFSFWMRSMFRSCACPTLPTRCRPWPAAASLMFK